MADYEHLELNCTCPEPGRSIFDPRCALHRWEYQAQKRRAQLDDEERRLAE